jgi:hypothetical protein
MKRRVKSHLVQIDFLIPLGLLMADLTAFTQDLEASGALKRLSFYTDLYSSYLESIKFIRTSCGLCWAVPGYQYPHHDQRSPPFFGSKAYVFSGIRQLQPAVLSK